MSDQQPFTELQMLALTASGIGKMVHRQNGAFLTSRDELEAMALTLIALGMPVLKPGDKITDPDTFFQPISQRFGA